MASSSTCSTLGSRATWTTYWIGYLDLTGNTDYYAQYQGTWTVESHLVFLMARNYNICVADSPQIWAEAVREEYGCSGITGCRSQQPMPIQQFWRDLSGKLV